MVRILWCNGGSCGVPWPRELHFSRDLSNWTYPAFSSITFQNFQGISDVLPEVPKFRHQRNICSKCSTSLASSLNLRLISCWNESCPCWVMLLPWQIHVLSLKISATQCCRGPPFSFILVCTGTARNRQRFAQRWPIWRKMYRIQIPRLTSDPANEFFG